MQQRLLDIFSEEELYEQALQVITRQIAGASGLNNLGMAYYLRTRGELADNIEKAIDYYQQALQVRTREAPPEKWERAGMPVGHHHHLANA